MPNSKIIFTFFSKLFDKVIKIGKNNFLISTFTPNVSQTIKIEIRECAVYQMFKCRS